MRSFDGGGFGSCGVLGLRALRWFSAALDAVEGGRSGPLDGQHGRTDQHRVRPELGRLDDRTQRRELGEMLDYSVLQQVPVRTDGSSENDQWWIQDGCEAGDGVRNGVGRVTDDSQRGSRTSARRGEDAARRDIAGHSQTPGAGLDVRRAHVLLERWMDRADLTGSGGRQETHFAGGSIEAAVE